MVLSEILIEETRHVTVFPCTVYIIQICIYIIYIYILWSLYHVVHVGGIHVREIPHNFEQWKTHLISSHRQPEAFLAPVFLWLLSIWDETWKGMCGWICTVPCLKIQHELSSGFNSDSSIDHHVENTTTCYFNLFHSMASKFPKSHPHQPQAK